MAEDGSKYNLEVSSQKGIVGDISGGTVNQYIISNLPEDRIKERDLIEQSPYKGLEKFEPEDKDKFFGREQLIGSLSKDLEYKNLLLILGASGSGKSSLVRAGLIPKFLDKKFVNLTFVPDEDPFESLYSCLIPKYGIAKAKIARQGEADTLIQVVNELKKDSRWFIFIDQFEELFTISQKTKRDKFIDSLIKLTQKFQKDNSIKIVLTMRADFLDKISPYPSLGKIHDHYSRMLTDMSEGELRLVIAEPAARNGIVFQEGLVKQILDDFHGQPGFLPLLQYTLDLLWEKDDITNRILNTQTYYDLGRVTGALQQQANKVYDELLPEEKEAAKQILLDVVDVVGGKPVSRRVDKTNFKGDVLARTLDKLTRNRLLVISQQDKQKPTIAVAHEALLTSWQTLQDWIKEDQETIVIKNRLIDDAKHWLNLKIKEPQQANSELWSGSKLERIIELKGKLASSNLSQDANQFIDASVAWRDEERQRQLKQEKKARKAAEILNRVATISLVGLTGLTVFGFYQWREAQINFIMTLVQTSRTFSVGEQKLAALTYAVQAGKRLQNPLLFPDTATHESARIVLQEAVDKAQKRNRSERYSELINSIVFSRDGKTLASSSSDTTIKLWNVATGKVINTLNEPSSDEVERVIFDPWTGKALTYDKPDNRVKIWDVATGKVISTLNGHSSKVNSQFFSPDGKILASRSSDGTIKLWDVATGGVINTLNGYSGDFKRVVFSRDNKTLASSSSDGTIKLWDVVTGGVIKMNEPSSDLPAGKIPYPVVKDNDVTSLVFSPDGKTLASGGIYASVRFSFPKEENLNDLMTISCDWIGGYLQHNADSDYNHRTLCEGIATQK